MSAGSPIRCKTSNTSLWEPSAWMTAYSYRGIRRPFSLLISLLISLLGRWLRWFFHRRRDLGSFGVKLHRNRIDTVAGILFGDPFPHKNMAQMTATVLAENLGSVPVRIENFFDRLGNFVVKARPAAVAVKLVFGQIQRGVAASAFGPCLLCGIRRAWLPGCQPAGPRWTASR